MYVYVYDVSYHRIERNGVHFQGNSISVVMFASHNLSSLNSGGLFTWNNVGYADHVPPAKRSVIETGLSAFLVGITGPV